MPPQVQGWPPRWPPQTAEQETPLAGTRNCELDIVFLLVCAYTQAIDVVDIGGDGESGEVERLPTRDVKTRHSLLPPQLGARPVFLICFYSEIPAFDSALIIRLV